MLLHHMCTSETCEVFTQPMSPRYIKYNIQLKVTIELLNYWTIEGNYIAQELIQVGVWTLPVNMDNE